MPHRLFALGLMTTLTFGLTACLDSGGSSGGSKATAQNEEEEAPEPEKRMGYFVDAPVEGIKYIANSTSGFTDSLGGYEYVPGEVVEFYLGAVHLGSVEGQWMITPVTLDPSGEASGNASRNMTRLFVTLDEDANPENGITLSAAAHRAFRSGGLSFDLETGAFADTDSVKNALDELDLTGLVPLSYADSHLADTLEKLPTLQSRDHIAQWTEITGLYQGNPADSNGSQEAIRRLASLLWQDQNEAHLSLGWAVIGLNANFLVTASEKLNETCGSSSTDPYQGKIGISCNLPSSEDVKRSGLDLQNLERSGFSYNGDVIVETDRLQTTRDNIIGRWHRIEFDYVKVSQLNVGTFILDGVFEFWDGDPTLDRLSKKPMSVHVIEDLVFKNADTGNAIKLVDFELERFGMLDPRENNKRHYYTQFNGDICHYREGCIHTQTQDDWGLGLSQEVEVEGDSSYRPLAGSSMFFSLSRGSEPKALNASLTVYDGYDAEGRTKAGGRVQLDYYGLEGGNSVVSTAQYRNGVSLGEIALGEAEWQVLGSLEFAEASVDDTIIGPNDDIEVSVPEIYDPNTGKSVATSGIWVIDGVEVAGSDVSFLGTGSDVLSASLTEAGQTISYVLATVSSADETDEIVIEQSITVASP